MITYVIEASTSVANHLVGPGGKFCRPVEVAIVIFSEPFRESNQASFHVASVSPSSGSDCHVGGHGQRFCRYLLKRPNWRNVRAPKLQYP